MLMLNLLEASKINSVYSLMFVQNGTKILRLETLDAMKPVASATEREIKIALFAEMTYPSLPMVSAIRIVLHMHPTT
jgi:hypothetical protein